MAMATAGKREELGHLLLALRSSALLFMYALLVLSER